MQATQPRAKLGVCGQEQKSRDAQTQSRGQVISKQGCLTEHGDHRNLPWSQGRAGVGKGAL